MQNADYNILFLMLFFRTCCCLSMNQPTSSRLLALLLGEENGVDVRKHTSRGDGDSTHEFIELLVVADGKLDVARDDAALLIITSGISGQLKDLSAEVL